MFTAEELLRKIGACENGSESFQNFVDWFEGNCNGAYEGELRDACIAIDAAISEYHYDNVAEQALVEELATAIHSFVHSEPVVTVVYSEPKPRALPLHGQYLAVAATLVAVGLCFPLSTSSSARVVRIPLAHGKPNSTTAAPFVVEERLESAA